MKQPMPIFLIDNPGLIIESKIALWGFRKSYHLSYSLLVTIY